MHKFDILGSCVTRDALEFVRNGEIVRYVGRQSIASIVAAPASAATIAQLKFKPTASPFGQRVVQQDFEKTALHYLDGAHNTLVIDLIDERMGLARSHCGALLTNSQATAKFSNGCALMAARIAGFSDEHVQLFAAALPALARALKPRAVMIHHAYYAPGKWAYEQPNNTLRRMYEMLAKALPDAARLEVEVALRVANPGHKWGLAPYHYIDRYYRQLVAQMSKVLAVEPRDDMTMEKLEAVPSSS